MNAIALPKILLVLVAAMTAVALPTPNDLHAEMAGPNLPAYSNCHHPDCE